MRNKVIIIISWLLVLMTMLIIFNFSGQTSAQSTVVSEGVVVQILGIVMDKEEITPPVVQKFQVPIRKLAHFGIYMLLGFCMISAFEKTFKLKKIWNIVLSACACALYAVTDETHQNFTAGRGPSFTDVLIDTGGAIVGVFIFVAFMYLYGKLMNRKVGGLD